jgi:hypothetical protein
MDSELGSHAEFEHVSREIQRLVNAIAQDHGDPA